jgi:heme/copper-type cytochrome/quinol oxidase subunit 4
MQQETSALGKILLGMLLVIILGIMGMWLCTEPTVSQEKTIKKVKYYSGMQVLVTKTTRLIGHIDSTTHTYILDSIEYKEIK